jgi:hypothetical protein
VVLAVIFYEYTMNNNRRLRTWQVVLITLGVVLIAGPLVWDALLVTLVNVANIEAGDVFTRAGAFVVGAVLLAIVGIYEFVKDANDKPTSKHIK